MIQFYLRSQFQKTLPIKLKKLSTVNYYRLSSPYLPRSYPVPTPFLPRSYSPAIGLLLRTLPVPSGLPSACYPLTIPLLPPCLPEPSALLDTFFQISTLKKIVNCNFELKQFQFSTFNSPTYLGRTLPPFCIYKKTK